MDVQNDTRQSRLRSFRYTCWACEKNIRQHHCRDCDAYFFGGHAPNCPCLREEHIAHMVDAGDAG